MGEQYVSFKTARMLKEVEFDERCRLSYDVCGGTCVMEGRNSDLPPRYISCPTQALAERWLREKHKLHVYTKVHECSMMLGLTDIWYYTIYPIGESCIAKDCIIGMTKYSSYEKAMEVGLQKAIKLVKK